jgi:hypothetical protein
VRQHGGVAGKASDAAIGVLKHNEVSTADISGQRTV